MPPDLRSIRSFTLVELLIVIAILAVLSAAVVLVLNPAEMIAQARDAQRVTDLKNLNSSLNIWVVDNPSASLGLDNKVYLSLPDNTSSTCASISGLPPLPVGWTYNCVTAANLRKTDGNGWIPVNLNSGFGGSTLPFLPIDPTNDSASGKYYTYTPGGSFELTAMLESQKKHDAAIMDGGSLPGIYQVGSHIDLTPIVRDNGLVGYWKFDEGSGTTAADSTGKWGNVTLVNGTAWQSGATCRRGGCLSLDGVDDYASISAKSSLFGSIHGPVTILAWFNPSSTTGIHSVIADSSPEIQMYTNGTSAFGRGYNATAMGTVGVGSWYFGAVSHDNPTGFLNTVIKAYLNGSFVSQTTKTITTENGYTNEAFYIGGYPTDAQLLQGYVDELWIYNRALSEAEIKTIYDATSS